MNDLEKAKFNLFYKKQAEKLAQLIAIIESSLTDVNISDEQRTRNETVIKMYKVQMQECINSQI
jgi:hypothetical protein